ncbi:SAM-dependent methyltransferase, type 11 [Citrifermentans bemidjiense Bem]|uniref:SAM-dependent methyltransferase, type 11 n=1 Tax=Citrifermentans bemidjiense (strain ATCC BAA-1014 / DSM 16622 / JCM 12645 / Bem) TaxID=404380 RepID=B5EGU4_CITBB|nr:class I SAM-dependent methyltransferase [Citrifermentans bemidjiense]ACH39577.1 SAM-dependent methyltransferase, type 11 [Citrifermentans bemidjiense Bem]
MNCFGAYSHYYDLLYKDKDYAGEARYIDELIRKHSPGAKRILNLGCGTGRHDFELMKLGYQVTGLDLSEEMLAVAAKRLTDMHPGPAPAALRFLQGDVRTVRLGETFDVVISLFHVMSYQSTNDDLHKAFATAKAHVAPGGLFLFDCWYGPAVLSDPPVVRVKRLEDDVIEVVRIAEPEVHYNANTVDVNYQVLITEKATGRVSTLKETHTMRYLFMPEVEGLFAAHGMEMTGSEEWGTGNEPGSGTWAVLFAGVVA